jgi:hypothetical protein
LDARAPVLRLVEEDLGLRLRLVAHAFTFVRVASWEISRVLPVSSSWKEDKGSGLDIQHFLILNHFAAFSFINT